ncbi:MAG: hypothetical protein R2860_17070 [Desulfobacterales bacterium]
MLIGAYAMGAEYGIIYVREEYPHCCGAPEPCPRPDQGARFTGENILHVDFSFNLSENGESVCLRRRNRTHGLSIEAGACPSPRPPFPAQAGLDGKPTNINNVETLANIP